MALLEPQLQDGWLIRAWPDIQPFPYAWTLGSSLALGPVAAWLVNLFYDEEMASINALLAGNDSMERLLFEAALFDDKLVEVTLVSGKVYAGWVLGSTAIRDRKYVEVMPIASGYRSDETLMVRFTTNYAQVLELDEIDWDDHRVVIPISEIRTARPFDMDIYKRFQRRRRPASPRRARVGQ